MTIIVRTPESDAYFNDADAAIKYEQAMLVLGRTVVVEEVSNEEAQAELKG